MTEDEAKTKWCPFARYQSHEQPSANRWKQSLPADEPHATNPVPCRCIASDCTAWRWDKPSYEYADGSQPPEGDGWRRVMAPFPAAWTRERPKGGFCGLAGEPRA